MSQSDSSAPICGIRRFVERDIDLLIAEELRVNAGFCKWITSHFEITDRLIYPAIMTNVSEVEDGSEADVAALFATMSGRRHRLFFENKIDAGLMPEQLERYIRRGTAEVTRGLVSDFSVIFLTPSNYLRASVPAPVRQLSFEEVAAHLRSASTDLRSEYRASLLEKAIPVFGSRNRDVRTLQSEPYIVAWWDAVYAMLEAELPGYFIHQTRYPQSVFFAPSTAGQAKYLRLDFKGHKGEVDLAFKNVDLETLALITQALPGIPGRLVSNGQSSAIQISGLEPFVISEGLEVIPTKVRNAYLAAHSLFSYWQTHRAAFDSNILPTPNRDRT